MRLVETGPNVTLRRDAGGELEVVLAFPYDARIVTVVRGIPHRRFDWDAREWYAPATDRAGVHVADVLERFPQLTASDEVGHWLRAVGERWIGDVRTARRGGRGWFVLHTKAGPLPAGLRALAVRDGQPLADPGAAAGAPVLVPLTADVAALLRAERSATLDGAAERCAGALLAGEELPPPARLAFVKGVDRDRLRLDPLWDPDAAVAYGRLPGAAGTRSLPLDPWVVPGLDAFLGLHPEVDVTGTAATALRHLRAEHDAAAGAVRASRATAGEPLPGVAARVGGTLEPFQWAGVRYVLEHRRCFLADEQGLGKTVQALAALEADGAFPAVVVCPASLKLNWERETARWLPGRSVRVISGRAAVPPTADVTILNYELVEAHRDALARRGPRALVVDEAHYVKNPRAKRTAAVRRLAERIPDDGLRLALTGTPVLNHPEELIAQLRILGRLGDYGSGARFAQQFSGQPMAEERLHWHLRRRCFARRLKSEVLPQLPAKRRVVVPVALANEREYRLAERDVIEWLRSQPLDLRALEAKVAAALRAERLAQLGALQRLAATGKLAAALAWIEDFLAHDEPLVVFARHREVQEAVLERFPGALHILGRDDVAAREAAVRAFQDPEGPLLLVGGTKVAGQGLTLTRASNACFLELEWTPAMLDQAEDRLHRIGQHDAVTAWYLLAADSIDETMSELLERKRGLVAAVTDGRRVDGPALADEVARALRDGPPRRHLRAVS